MEKIVKLNGTKNIMVRPFRNESNGSSSESSSSGAISPRTSSDQEGSMSQGGSGDIAGGEGHAQQQPPHHNQQQQQQLPQQQGSFQTVGGGGPVHGLDPNQMFILSGRMSCLPFKSKLITHVSEGKTDFLSAADTLFIW